jgi:flagellar biosynthesis/type III secretory pathway M-ring protein FliF/YscJ
MNSDDIAILTICSLIAVAVLLRPVMRAWARRIGGEAANPGQSNEIAELRERVAELEGSGTRLQELEERVDFAERMLAQRQEPAPLPLHRTPT